MTSQYPHFIQQNLIHSCDFYITPKHRSRLALLKNLNFYELKNKRVINSINLRDSILRKVQSALESHPPGLNEIHSQTSDILGNSIVCPSQVGGIVVGKYIYQNRVEKSVYIILKCWDSMVIIKKSAEGFAQQAEYEGVHSFKITNDKKYESKLEISFIDGEHILTNFQENHSILESARTGKDYKKLLDRIKIKQSELLVHKTISKKEFARLKSSEIFGCNFIRTPQLEEMQILSKCGDAWIKVTADDNVVIGVPLVNNSSSRLITISNLRSILQCHSNRDMSYRFSLHQLSERFCDIENISNFFQSAENDSDSKYSWSQCPNYCLRPDAFCVLIVSLKIDELVDFDAVELLLFAFYDIVIEEKTFSQKCFLTTLDFRDIFSNDAYKISFNEHHLHRDLLTVIATSHEANLHLEFTGSSTSFENYLCEKMNFSRVNSPDPSEIMNVDGQDEESNQTLEQSLFYNKNRNSLWHGTLLAITYTYENCTEIKLYTKTQEKSKVFMKCLNIELRTKCGIKKISCDSHVSFAKLIGFEAALRDECYSHLKICSALDVKEKQESSLELLLNQFKTDLMLKALES